MKRFILLTLCGLLAFCGVNAYGKTNSNWKETQTVVIPQSVEIHEGVTRGGNPKFWIEIDDIQVSVSPSNATKFKNNEVKLELVKWQNTETGKIRYSTRQVKGKSSKKETKNIDLTGLFK